MTERTEVLACLEAAFPNVSKTTLRVLFAATWNELERLDERNVNVEVTR
jgi:hypothetical protein